MVVTDMSSTNSTIQYKNYVKSQKKWRGYADNLAKPIISIALFFMASTAGLMAFAAFPWITPLGAVGLILAGTLVDMLVYFPGARKGFKTFLGSGMLNELDDELRADLAEQFLKKESLQLYLQDKHIKQMLKAIIVKTCQAQGIDMRSKNDLKALQPKQKRHIWNQFLRKLGKTLGQRHKFYDSTASTSSSKKNSHSLKGLIQTYDQQFDRKAYRSRYRWKSFFLSAAFLGAFANGAAFFAIIAAENFEFWAITSLAAPMAAPIMAAALVVGLVQGLLFYKSFKSCIVKGGWSKFKRTLAFEYLKENEQVQGIAVSTPKNLLKWGLMASIIPLSIISVLLTQSTILNSFDLLIEMSSQALQAYSIQGPLLINAIIQFSMYFVLLPASLWFTAKHTVGACQKLTNTISAGLCTLKPANFKECLYHPIRTLLYAIVYTTIFAALLIHTFTESMMEAGQGVFNATDKFSQLFSRFSLLLRMTPQPAAAATQGIRETAEHLDFVCVNGNKLYEFLATRSIPARPTSLPSKDDSFLEDENNLIKLAPTIV